MTTAEKLTTIAENQEKVFEAGRDKALHDWMYQYQKHPWNGDNPTTDYLYAFAGPCWKDELYNPVRPMLNLTRTTSMFAYSYITDTKVEIGVVKANNAGATFQNAINLVTVRKFTVTEDAYMKNQFSNCTKLANLEMGGTIGGNANFQWCPLTKASILSVFAALSDTATGVTAQFKTSAVNTAFETSEGAGDGSTSTEWQALVDSKPNWTIALTEP